MALTITDQEIRSPNTRHTAERVTATAGEPVTVEMSDGGRGSAWRVSWLPSRTLDRNQAITAMTIAETVATHDLTLAADPMWDHIDNWAAELGIDGPDAVSWAKESPESAAGRPR